jgi:hypothetical protein
LWVSLHNVRRRRLKMRQIAMLLMVLGLAVFAAQGAPVFQENFDSYTSWPDGGWSTVGTTGLSSPGNGGSGQALELTRPASGETAAWHSFTEQSTGTVTAYIGQSINSSPGSAGGLRFLLSDFTAGKDLGYICLTEDGFVTMNTTNGYFESRRIGTYEADTWYPISISWDAVAKTVTASFDGGTPLTLGYAEAGANIANGLMAYNANTSGGTWYSYVDDIVVTPEPATMGLLALGGLGMLIRRKR